MAHAAELRVAVIRISFQEDFSPATTGDGSFVLHDTVDLDCPDWTLDPPPHDQQYFLDHLQAADNYWRKVSQANLSIDLNNSQVFPDGDTSSYQLPHEMLYYHPYSQDYDETAKLFELARDALALADAEIDFTQFTTVILVHAGMGGDFAFALDPTPGNIPSAYLSTADFQIYGNLETAEGPLTDLIILPESQNFLQYRETRTLFADSNNPCFYQVGLNGTLALMLGFHIGLPPLYNTESGRSLVGGFALMDQGSNNFHGIVPAYPSPYSRIRQGWETAVAGNIGDTVTVSVDGPPVKVSISDREYYLIENRQRNLEQPVGMPEWIDGPGFDTVSVELAASGVVLDVDEQHAGLPGNGLYIWHVDEDAWLSADNPNGGSVQLVDFVEADGAQDMGYTTQLLFADYLETGWWFDPWYAGNAGWFHLNRNQEVTPDSLLTFGPHTNPATIANDGTPSHLIIGHISANGSSMQFTLSSERFPDTDALGGFLGWAADREGFYALNRDSSQVLLCRLTDGELDYSINSLVSPDLLFEDSIDSVLIYRYPWVATRRSTGLRFLNIATGAVHYFTQVDSIRELAVNGSLVSYFARRNQTDVLVSWNTASGTTVIQGLLSPPQSRFQTGNGIHVWYGDAIRPFPVGIADQSAYHGEVPVPDMLTIVSWSDVDSRLKISYLPEAETTELELDRPEYILPCDPDEDGRYELALFYPTSIRIIEQNGVVWNGNPFGVAPYFGNPLIMPSADHGPVIFLRHTEGYALYSFSGVKLESGVLPSVQDDLVNTLGRSEGDLLVWSGSSLLYFPAADTEDLGSYWIDPRGSAGGDRVIVLKTPAETNTDLKIGSCYNYPNPVKGQVTTIRSWIGNADTWTIEIFSMDGHQVAYVTLDVSQQNAYNEWIWNAGQVSNGVYLAQVRAGDQAQIVKIAVIR